MSRRVFAVAAVSGTIVGYPTVAFLSHYLPVSNPVISAAYRALLLGGGCWGVLWYGVMKRGIQPENIVTLSGVVFLIAYSARIVYTVLLTNDPVMHPRWEYIPILLGSALVPFGLGASIVGEERERAYSWVFGLAFAALAANAITALAGQQDILSVGWDHQTISAIGLGHLAGMVFSLAILGALKKSEYRVRLSVLALCVFPLVLMSGALGPLVTVVVAFALLVPIGLQDGGARSLALGLLCPVGVTVGILLIVGSHLPTVLESLELSYSLSNVNVQNRVRFVETALAGWMDSPIIGAGLEIQNALGRLGVQRYPHNMFVEALYTTGLVGGVPFILFNIGLGVYAVRLIKRRRSEWIVLLWIMSLTGALFSGSMWAAMRYWVTAGLIIAAWQGARLSAMEDRKPSLQ